MKDHDDNYEVEYYAIQGKFIKPIFDYLKDKWFEHIDSVSAGIFGIPVTVRTKTIPGDDDPTEFGSIYQQYGVHGVTKLDAAKFWLKETIKQHTKKNEENELKGIESLECTFRIVKVTRIQKVEPIE